MLNNRLFRCPHKAKIAAGTIAVIPLILTSYDYVQMCGYRILSLADARAERSPLPPVTTTGGRAVGTGHAGANPSVELAEMTHAIESNGSSEGPSDTAESRQAPTSRRSRNPMRRI